MSDEERIVLYALDMDQMPWGRFHNPFRDDKIGDCYLKKRSNYLRLIDFPDKGNSHHANCYDMVMLKHFGRKINSKEDMDIVRQIISDKLGIGGTIKKADYIREDHFDYIIEPDYRKWNSRDAWYWSQYGIDGWDLYNDGIRAVSGYWRNSRKDPGWMQYVECDELAYCMMFEDGKCKIYQPKRSGKDGKWDTNCRDKHIWFNDYTLPVVTFVTGSYKDGKVVQHCGYQVKAMQSESSHPPEYIVEGWIQQSSHLILLFDIDKAGRRLASAFVDKFGHLGRIYDGRMTSKFLEYECKDIADIRRKFGLVATHKTLYKIVNKIV